MTVTTTTTTTTTTAVVDRLLAVVVDDRIVRDRFWCGGRWPAPLLAQMEAARR